MMVASCAANQVAVEDSPYIVSVSHSRYRDFGFVEACSLGANKSNSACFRIESNIIDKGNGDYLSYLSRVELYFQNSDIRKIWKFSSDAFNYPILSEASIKTSWEYDRTPAVGDHIEVRVPYDFVNMRTACNIEGYDDVMHYSNIVSFVLRYSSTSEFDIEAAECLK